MSLTQDVYDTLPPAVQSDYVQNEETKEYVTADSLKFAGAKKNLDSAYSERDKFKGELTAQQQAAEDRIKEAEEAAYAKAVSENDTSKLLEIEQQKADDRLKRAEKSEEKYNSLRSDLAKEKENAIIDGLLSHATPTGKQALSRILKGYVKVDPETGGETYLNDDGSASSLNKEQFITEQLKQNPVFTSLVSADIVTNSNGLANGSQGNNNYGGAPATLEACKGDRKLEAAYFNAQFNK